MCNSKEIVLKSKTYDSIEDMMTIGKIAVSSGYFKDITQVSSAVMKIMAGAEMGFSAFTSIQGVHVINGKPVLSANLMASAIKKTGKYNYRVKQHNDENCLIEFYELINGKWETAGSSSFSMKDAKSAGLDNQLNWKKFPRNMLFARAMSNGIKWYCPDALNGNAVYTPDEVGCSEDGDGNLIVVNESHIPKEQVRRTETVATVVNSHDNGYYEEIVEKPVEDVKKSHNPKGIKANNGENQVTSLKRAVDNCKTKDDLVSLWNCSAVAIGNLSDEHKAEVMALFSQKRNEILANNIGEVKYE